MDTIYRSVIFMTCCHIARDATILPAPTRPSVRTLDRAVRCDRCLGTGLWLAGGALYLTRDVDLSATSVGAGLTVAGLVDAVTAGRPVFPAVALLLAATAVWTVGDLWHGAAGAGLAYDLAPPGSIGAYQGADGLLAGLAQALGRGLLTLLVLGGGGVGWLVLGALYAAVGLTVPALVRRAVASRPAPPGEPTGPPGTPG